MITSPYAIPIWLNFVFVCSLATVLYWGSTKYSARVFAVFVFLVAAITGVWAYFDFTPNYALAVIGIRASYFLAAVLGLAVIYFVVALEKESIDIYARPGWKFKLSIIIAGLFLFILNFFTNIISTAPVRIINSPVGMTWGWVSGPFVIVHLAFILICYVVAIVKLIKLYKYSHEAEQKTNILFISAGIITGFTIPFIFNGVLSYSGFYEYAWIGASSSIIWVSIMGYSIIKHHQMNVRVVATEVLVIAMVVVAFVNIFVGDFLGVSSRIFFFGDFLVLGSVIIRGALKQAEQREQLNDLNDNLQKRVDEQTSQIRKSYEVEKAARLELEKLNENKNQFIMITQHHLRTPMTSIKWQLEAVLNGTYGKLDDEPKKALADMSESVNRLSHLIDSLLSISALRSGIETIKKAPTSLLSIVTDIISELDKEIARKHLKLTLPSVKENWPPVSVDPERMKEALFIIIENAVRYNIDNGTIIIQGTPTESKIDLVVENTGMEMSGDDKKKIFSELFYRSQQAQTSHPTGVGIGLTMAQAIIEAHDGSISFGSRKEPGGVKVTVTLPY